VLQLCCKWRRGDALHAVAPLRATGASIWTIWAGWMFHGLRATQFLFSTELDPKALVGNSPGAGQVAGARSRRTVEVSVQAIVQALSSALAGTLAHPMGEAARGRGSVQAVQMRVIASRM
jgi:hypothetical protein